MSELTKATPPKMPKGLGAWHKIVASLKGAIDGPKHTRGMLPLGMLEPQIAQTAHQADERLQRLVAVWKHHEFAIPAALEHTAFQIARAEAELQRRVSNLGDHRRAYADGHDGLQPPWAGSIPFARRLSFWILGILFAVGEWPLMSAALDRLPLPDWQRLVAAAGASAVAIYLSHHVGVWFAKPAKTFGQRVFGWFLVAVLLTVLTAASMVRSSTLKDDRNPPVNAPPAVRLNAPKGLTYV